MKFPVLRCAVASAIIATALTTTSCRDKTDAVDKNAKKEAEAPAGKSAYPGTPEGAKDMLSAFLKPGADLKALTLPLRPTRADAEAVFSAEFADKVFQMYDPAWAAGKLVLAPNEGQTDLILRSATTDEIIAWEQNASDNLPGGYEGIKDHFKKGLTVYAFKFVAPGETSGMAFDGLVYVNGQWRIFPKPFRAAK